MKDNPSRILGFVLGELWNEAQKVQLNHAKVGLEMTEFGIVTVFVGGVDKDGKPQRFEQRHDYQQIGDDWSITQMIRTCNAEFERQEVARQKRVTPTATADDWPEKGGRP